LLYKKQSQISFKNGFFKKRFNLVINVFWSGSLTSDFDKNILSFYGFNVKKIIRSYNIIIGVTKYSNPCSAWFYEFIDLENNRFRVMNILDIAVKYPYRNKGIGSQILSIFNDIAKQNNCDYICIELGNDYPEEPLESQRRFFERHGFIFKYNKLGEFSGWFGMSKI